MSERGSDDLYVGGFGGNDQIDPAEAGTGDNTEDPLDAGYTVPERPNRSWRGDTVDEERAGESLDQHLAEEEPDVGEADLSAADEERRAGRLVAPDDGGPDNGYDDREADEIATDAGRAGYAASAEEAAVHIQNDDDR